MAPIDPRCNGGDNSLTTFQKEADRDKSLQKDRITTKDLLGESIRSRPQSTGAENEKVRENPFTSLFSILTQTGIQ